MLVDAPGVGSVEVPGVGQRYDPGDEEHDVQGEIEDGLRPREKKP